MKLIDLFPQFYRVLTDRRVGRFIKTGADPLNYTEADIEEREYDQIILEPVDSITDADGIRFTDPVWAKDHPGVDGYDFGKSVHVGFAGRKTWGMQDTSGKPVAWGFSGTGYSDLTITPSIFVMPHANPPGWHGFVTSGEVTTV